MKDEAGNSTTVRARVALLHIIDTSRLLKVLKCDKSAIFKAAAEASKALDYLIGLQPGSPTAGPESAAPEPAAPAAGRAIPTRRAKPGVA